MFERAHTSTHALDTHGYLKTQRNTHTHKHTCAHTLSHMTDIKILRNGILKVRQIRKPLIIQIIFPEIGLWMVRLNGYSAVS